MQKELIKILANIRELIFQTKHEICEFLDMKDNLIDNRVNNTENALCEYSLDIDKNIINIENALCELSILLNDT